MTFFSRSLRCRLDLSRFYAWQGSANRRFSFLETRIPENPTYSSRLRESRRLSWSSQSRSSNPQSSTTQQRGPKASPSRLTDIEGTPATTPQSGHSAKTLPSQSQSLSPPQIQPLQPLRPTFSSSNILPNIPPRDADIDWEELSNEERAKIMGSRPALTMAQVAKAMHPGVYKALTITPFQWREPTKVQSEVWRILPTLSSLHPAQDNAPRDLLCKAPTGTGKTAAFLVPAIQLRLKKLEEVGKQAEIDGAGLDDPDIAARARQAYARGNVGALILSPTRELAMQIAQDCARLTAHLPGFETQLIVAGISKKRQMSDWMKGRRDIVVSTAGRFVDLLNTEPDVARGLIDCQTFILDEADEMLKAGFRSDIDRVRLYLPPTPQLQTMMFSATVPRPIEQLARSVLCDDARFIDCKTAEQPETLDQYFTILPTPGYQIPHLLNLIRQDQLLNPTASKIIIFLPTTKTTQLFATFLRELTMTLVPHGPRTNVYEIHSLKSKFDREAASQAFRADTSPASILVTSDVSARGVDYPDVTQVIQLGIPASDIQYTHRVGRTGRMRGEIKPTHGRSDLVLMPWEMGFITWCLADKEIKPLTVTELDETVLQLSSPSASMSSDLVSNPFTQAKLVQMHSDTYNTVGDLLQRLEPSAIKESFLSLLGYYIPKSDVLRAKKTVVLEGLRLWSTNVCGLEVPPYVSPEFLRKMGMWDNRSQHFSKPLEQMHRSVDPKKAPATRWLRAEDADDEEVKMYRTGLYKFERGRKQDQSSQAKPVI